MDTAVTTDPFFTAVDNDEIYELSTGQRLRSPVRYFDYSTFSVEYGIPVDMAQAWLPSTALRPVEISPGMTVISFRALDHRHTDLAPYQEFAVAVPAVYQSPSHPEELTGSYIIFLPVTTDEACIAGIEIANYPKVIADIEIEETPTRCHCRVTREQEETLSLVVDPRPVVTSETEATEGLLFNGSDDEMTVSRAVTQAVSGVSTNTDGAHITLAEHQLVAPFREIDLSTPAISCSYAPHSKMLLYGPHLRLPLSR